MVQITGSNTYGSGLSAMGNITSIAPSASINTINLGGITSQQIQSLNLNSVFSFTDPNVKRYEIIESKQDLIALSVCWKRMRDSNSRVTITSMLDDSLFSSVTQEDIDNAEKIRKHYLNKITVLALKNIELSNFRKDLKELVMSDGKKFKESFIPLAYRLPEFYDYDVEFESLLFDHNRELKNFKSSEPDRQTILLKPIKEFIVNNRQKKHKEYWFSDSNDNLVSYYVDLSNPLISLMDREFKRDLHVSARLRGRERDGYEYIKMFSVDFG